MKKYIAFIVLPLLLTSCKDWLDLRPFDRLEMEKVFPDEKTTNAALNGLYVAMSMDELYGKDMACGALEVLARHYDVPNTPGDLHHYHYLYNLTYTHEDVMAIFEKMFTAAYKTIADCNEFLQWVQAGKEQYLPARYEIYLGEAIGIRTYLHFDMLRLFGPMTDNLGSPSVPYYSLSTDSPRPIITADALIDSLLRDIDLAIDHLKNDPILENGTEMVDSDIDFFESYRNLRMNYFAAQAVKARILLYQGTERSKEQAYAIASGLLENTDPHTGRPVRFSSTFSFQGSSVREYVFADEIIFGIQNSFRSIVYKELFSADLSASKILTSRSGFVDQLYGREGSQVGGEDLGCRLDMWKSNTLLGAYEFLRFSAPFSYSNYPYHNDMMCLFRLGELYLIAAEAAPDPAKKEYWLEQLRNNRGYDPGNAQGLTEEQLNQMIAVEFEKETYGEGQYFFFGKRRAANLRNQDGSTAVMGRAEYVPALPEVETNHRKTE